MNRVLMVSSYPPRHCGIGRYARAQVERLRAEGSEVTVISPRDGDGDVRVPFFGGRPFLAAAKQGRRFDRIVVQFQPALYYRPRAPLSKIATSKALLWLCLRRRQTEILVHEADRPRWWRPDEVLLAAAFRAAPVLLFHTRAEKEALERQYRVRVRARLVRHVDGVAIRAPFTREDARRRLRLPQDEAVFVSPGFLQEHKGFDRAVDAFQALGTGRLYVVGSVRDATPENLAYAARLRRLAGATPGFELVDRFLEDEEFDAWIAAADAVLLPYRRSWSSGALARAQAIGTPAVVSAVGGLPEQASERDVVVRDDPELVKALRDIAQGVNRREVAP
ncbi:MAG TPA: glycosyltransferase family 4 protein [Actinomycetota bacterium]|nr:glycosyltransferase family 4 protein [Actinomycetota bacterium]